MAYKPVTAESRREPTDSRRALVSHWEGAVRAAKDHPKIKRAFARMREDQDFCGGDQWPNDPKHELYVANVALRHQQQRVAALYAKNPTAVVRVRESIEGALWDGSPKTLAAAQQALQMQMQAGMPQDPMLSAMVSEAMQVQQAQQIKKTTAKTLKLVYDHNVQEQQVSFKKGMKLTVRRAVTTGVGFVKLGFVRATEPRPEVTAQLAVASEQLARLEGLVAGYQGQEYDDTCHQMEELRLQIQALQSTPEMVLREGLNFDYPRSTAIIPDPETQVLASFLGADWVAQEYILTPERVREVYGVDLRKQFRHYRADDAAGGDDSDNPVIWTPDGARDIGDKNSPRACVWEIWSKRDQMVYVIADGHPDFLREPAPPDVWTERFWPFFALVLNELDSEGDLYPPSDIRLLRHQQQEINRARQGLREHRIANRPKTAAAGGVLSDEDKAKLTTHPANALIELSGLAPGQKIDDLLQPVKMPGIDPNLYETNSVFEDILRTVGAQEASFGTVAGGTATESSIAESSRQSSLASNMDDLDDMLTEMARASGQILLTQMSEDTVKKIAGPGAAWPVMSRQDAAQELVLEIEAGSSGRPNQAQEINNLQQIVPLLIQIPGVSPEFLAREMLRRLDDRLNLDDAFDQAVPSIQAMNRGPGGPGAPGGANPEAIGAGPESDPAMQGPAGADNAPAAPPGPVMTQDQFPVPGDMLQ